MQVDIALRITMAICALIGGLGQAFMSGQELYTIAKEKKDKSETTEIKSEVKNKEV